MTPPNSVRLAQNTMLVVFSLVLLFHFLVLSGIIPFDMVWGGRLKNREQMIRFEIISLLINGVMMAVVLANAGVIQLALPHWLLQLAFWAMAVLFLLNTVGNLLSTSPLEKAIFTPITLLLFLCSLRLALSRQEPSNRLAAAKG